MLPQAKDPEKYSTGTKPTELNLYNNAPRTRNPAGHSLPPPPGPPPPMNFPYSYYPPPYMLPQWYAQPPPPAAPPMLPTPNLALPALKPSVDIEYPKISEWLAYCDQHPARRGEDFSAHVRKFNNEGYRRIHQLTGDRISVEKLSDWLSIGKGTADLLIRYAEEDVERIKAGTFPALT